jgi:hypothetical protein
MGATQDGSSMRLHYVGAVEIDLFAVRGGRSDHPSTRVAVGGVPSVPIGS